MMQQSLDPMAWFQGKIAGSYGFFRMIYKGGSCKMSLKPI